MRFRKLRIAWTVGWGLVAVLSVVWCMRSYWHWDTIWGRVAANKSIVIQSLGGRIAVLTLPYGVPWEIGSVNKNETWRDSILRHAFMGRKNATLSATGEKFIFAFRHWYLIAGSFLLGATSWLRWRFSLRTLLVATTMVALLLGLIVWLIK
jgi:hypothetical protein